jgi:hypothetical protein
MMRRACLLTAVLLSVPVGVALLGLLLCAGPAWSQGQMIPGNRTLAGTLNAGPSTGTGAAYVLTLSPPITAYVLDQFFAFRAHTANTGSATLNVNGAGAKVLKKWQAGALVDLVAGDIPAGRESIVYYDGTVFQVVTAGSAGAGGGGGTSIGPAGGLQASAGDGGFAAYSGAACTVAGTFARGLSNTGALDCQPATTSTLTAKAWLSQPGSDAPNGVNMGALSPGLVKITVSSGVATPSTVAEPAGSLVGTTQVQTLTNTRVTPRRQMAQNTAVSVQVNVDTTDIVTIANLQQGLTVTDVTGSADPGQWVRFELCSASAQTLSWSSQWSGEAGLPLPTQTKGGGYCDLLLFQYNATSGHFVLVSNVDVLSRSCPGILPPGSYTNTNLTVDARGCISAVSTGTGGPGGTATPAGVSGDVQFNLAGNLAADSHNLAYDAANTLAVQNIQMGRAGGYIKFQDAGGRKSYLMQGSRLTNTRVYTLPNEDGELCVKGGSCAGAGGLSASGTPTSGQTAEWVSASAIAGVGTQGTGNYVKAATAGASGTTFLRGDFTWATPAGGGNVSNVGTPTSGQLAEWTSATTIQGVPTQGTGNPVRATSPTITTPSIGALANLTTNGVVTTTAGTGTLVVDQTAVQTLTSSATYTCQRNGTVNQCKMNMTGGAGTLTIASPTGTAPQDGDRMLMRIRCTSAQTLAFNAIFIASANVPLPTSCPADTTREVMIGALFSSDTTKWQIIATN